MTKTAFFMYLSDKMAWLESQRAVYPLNMIDGCC